MARNNKNAESDYAAVLTPSSPTHNLGPSKRQFKPWHKPRKHWIRVNQWCAETAGLIKGLRPRKEKVLTYLSLPGTDMLDVRILRDTCVELGYSVKYLGFNDPSEEEDNAQTELNISRAELAALEGIHQESEVVPDRFEAIASKTKLAFQKLESFGSFDVVNLDLCNSVAAHIPLEQQETYYSAIMALIQHQSEVRTEPWLLFLTTRADIDCIKPSALKGLLECVKANINAHPQFRTELHSAFNIDSIKINRAVNGTKLNPQDLFHTFNVAFGKWMLRILGTGQPVWTLDMLNSCSYHVRGNPIPDMVSLAYKCKPVLRPKSDPFKLAENIHVDAGAEAVSEREAALRLIKVAKDVVNLDVKLTKNSNEFQDLVHQAAELMARARYDRNAYVEHFSRGK